MDRTKLNWGTKVAKYSRGEYMLPVPWVCHDGWTQSDWIEYIDKHGKWLPSKLGRKTA